jgi:pimeloyl-ACP methyl ester carboxylesterase
VTILSPDGLAFLRANWFFILFGLFWGYLIGRQLGAKAPPGVRLLCVFGGGVFGIAGLIAGYINTGPKAELFFWVAAAAVLAMIALVALYGWRKE